MSSIPTSPPPIHGVSTSVTAMIGFASSGPLQAPTIVQSFLDYTNQFGPIQTSPGPASSLSLAAWQFFNNGGTSLYVTRIDSAAAYVAALEAFNSIPVPNLLCLPGVNDQKILAAAQAWCDKQGVFLIIDSDPSATTPAQLTAFMNGPVLPRSASAAVYGPCLEIPNPLGGSAVLQVPPSGAVAAIFARTDASAGVWKAPAGASASLSGVLGLTTTLTEADAGTLQQLGLNPIRQLPPAGFLIWGARTLVPAKAPGDYQYIPVRRLAIFFEQSISKGTQWATFEPNGTQLWSQIRLSVGAFLQGLFLQGAFQGQVPSNAYFVKCDATTTTQTDIAQGIVNIIVGFAPLKPAEFVVVQIQITAGPPAPGK